MEKFYKEQIKILKDLYNLLADELEITNQIIDISMSNEDYKKYREIAINQIRKEKEDEI